MSEKPSACAITPLDLEPIKARVTLAQRMFGVAFDGYPDTERAPVDIQRDRDRAALLREVERLRAALPSSIAAQESQLTPTTMCPDGEKHVLRCIRCELPASSRSVKEPGLSAAARMVLTALEHADLANDSLIWWEERELLSNALAAEGLIASPASQMCVTCGHDLATHNEGPSEDGCRFQFGWGDKCSCGWPVAAEVSSPARSQLEQLLERWKALRVDWDTDGSITAIARANIYGLCIQELEQTLAANQSTAAQSR